MVLDLAIHGNVLRSSEPAPPTQNLLGAGGGCPYFMNHLECCIVSLASGPRNRLGNRSHSISSVYLLQSPASHYFPCPTAITQVDAHLPEESVNSLKEDRPVFVELTGSSMRLY